MIRRQSLFQSGFINEKENGYKSPRMYLDKDTMYRGTVDRALDGFEVTQEHLTDLDKFYSLKK